MFKLISFCSCFLLGCGVPSMAAESPVQQDARPVSDEDAIAPKIELPPPPACEKDSGCFILIEKESIQLEGLDDFKFESILEDSRCPLDAVCIWEGQVKARITYRDSATALLNIVEIGLGPALEASWTDATTGTTVTLAQVWPAKLLATQNENEPYRIKIFVKAQASE